MASLKELQVRIQSVKSTRKITSAMKMVAASRLKKAQEAVNNAKEYNWALKRMLAVILQEVEYVNSKAVSEDNKIKLPSIMTGRDTDKRKKHLVIVYSSDKGLCGGFNSSIAKRAKTYIKELQKDRDVIIMPVGKKGAVLLKRDFSSLFVSKPDEREEAAYTFSELLSVDIVHKFKIGEIDECSVVYNKFVSAISQEPRVELLIPYVPDRLPEEVEEKIKDSYHYDFESDVETVLGHTIFNMIRNRLFRANVESLASEHGARMTSMDSATRNAGDIIDRLTLSFNRRRQANITTELVEIIAGAEAL